MNNNRPTTLSWPSGKGVVAFNSRWERLFTMFEFSAKR